MFLKRNIRCFCLILSVALFLTAVPIHAAQSNDSVSVQYEKNSYVPIETQNDEYIEICKNELYSMMLNPQSGVFYVGDAKTGEPLWYSGMTEDNFSGIGEVSAMWKAYMQSVAVVNYIARDATRANNMKAYSAESKNKTEIYAVDNGVRFEIDFKSIDVSLAIELRLDGERVVARIPAEDISENGNFVIKSIDVLPFFGAVSDENDEDGYIVYPDGNGAISYFDKAEYKHAYTQSISLDIYDTLDLETTLEDDKSATAMLPIYGIKDKNLGIMAAITEGSESARINVNTAVENAEMPIHRAEFELVYRNEYKIFLSNITGAVSGSETYGVKVDDELLPIDREVTYFLLRDDEANYSGMANVYREYLISNGLLSQSELADETGLYLSMFMGAQKENAIMNSFVSMTSFDYAREIAESLLESGVENLQMRLRGWNKGGYLATKKSFKPETKLGGKKDLKKLANLANTDERFGLQLELDYIETAKNRYVAVKESTVPITDLEESKYLLSPLRVESLLKKAIKSTSKFKGAEIAVADFGTRLYPDYSSSRKATRTDTVNLWSSIGENNAVTSVQGGNLYMLSSAQQLYDIPIYCSMNQMTDESVPWYSMIVSGSIPFTTVAGNKYGNLDLLCLKWIEYGSMPYFELTEESPTNLAKTKYNELFSSQFEKWGSKALEIYEDMSSRLKNVTGVAMIRHEKITDELVVITYENSYRVVINYGETAAEIYGQTVAPRDYVVLEP